MSYCKKSLAIAFSLVAIAEAHAQVFLNDKESGEWHKDLTIEIEKRYAYPGQSYLEPVVVAQDYVGNLRYSLENEPDGLEIDENGMLSWSSVTGAVSDTHTFKVHVEADTDPVDAADADNDGIPDKYEVDGQTYNGMDVFAMGARPNQSDIFVQIGWMDPTDGGRLDPATLIIPTEELLQRIQSTFTDKFADGYRIKVHFDVGDFFDQSPGINPSRFDLGGDFAGLIQTIQQKPWESQLDYVHRIKKSVSSYKRDFFKLAVFLNKRQGIRSTTFAHPSIETVIFVNPEYGSDEMDLELENMKFSDIVHELGHLLGLSHGGPNMNAIVIPKDVEIGQPYYNEGNDNYRPNFFSVMNYSYQTVYQWPKLPWGFVTNFYKVRKDGLAFPGPVGSTGACSDQYQEMLDLFTEQERNFEPSLEQVPIGYSEGLLDDINETEIFEFFGFGDALVSDQDITFNSLRYNGQPLTVTQGQPIPIDFDCDGIIDVLPYRLSINDETGGSKYQVFTEQTVLSRNVNEWNYLQNSFPSSYKKSKEISLEILLAGQYSVPEVVSEVGTHEYLTVSYFNGGANGDLAEFIDEIDPDFKAINSFTYNQFVNYSRSNPEHLNVHFFNAIEAYVDEEIRLSFDCYAPGNSVEPVTLKGWVEKATNPEDLGGVPTPVLTLPAGETSTTFSFAQPGVYLVAAVCEGVVDENPVPAVTADSAPDYVQVVVKPRPPELMVNRVYSSQLEQDVWREFGVLYPLQNVSYQMVCNTESELLEVTYGVESSGEYTPLQTWDRLAWESSDGIVSFDAPASLVSYRFTCEDVNGSKTERVKRFPVQSNDLSLTLTTDEFNDDEVVDVVEGARLNFNTSCAATGGIHALSLVYSGSDPAFTSYLAPGVELVTPTDYEPVSVSGEQQFLVPGVHQFEFICTANAFELGSTNWTQSEKMTINVTASPDSDDDGLNDYYESVYDTDPNNPDSDGDGYLDGYEVDNNKDPKSETSHPRPVVTIDVLTPLTSSVHGDYLPLGETIELNVACDSNHVAMIQGYYHQGWEYAAEAVAWQNENQWSDGSNTVISTLTPAIIGEYVLRFGCFDEHYFDPEFVDEQFEHSSEITSVTFKVKDIPPSLTVDYTSDEYFRVNQMFTEFSGMVGIKEGNSLDLLTNCSHTGSGRTLVWKDGDGSKDLPLVSSNYADATLTLTGSADTEGPLTPLASEGITTYVVRCEGDNYAATQDEHYAIEQEVTILAHSHSATTVEYSLGSPSDEYSLGSPSESSSGIAGFANQELSVDLTCTASTQEAGYFIQDENSATLSSASPGASLEMPLADLGFGSHVVNFACVDTQFLPPSTSAYDLWYAGAIEQRVDVVQGMLSPSYNDGVIKVKDIKIHDPEAGRYVVTQDAIDSDEGYTKRLALKKGLIGSEQTIAYIDYDQQYELVNNPDEYSDSWCPECYVSEYTFNMPGYFSITIEKATVDENEVSLSEIDLSLLLFNGLNDIEVGVTIPEAVNGDTSSIVPGNVYGAYIVDSISLLSTELEKGRYTMHVTNPVAGEVELRRDGQYQTTGYYNWLDTVYPPSSGMSATIDFPSFFSVSIYRNGGRAGIGSSNLYLLDGSIFNGLEYVYIDDNGDLQ